MCQTVTSICYSPSSAEISKSVILWSLKYPDMWCPAQIMSLKPYTFSLWPQQDLLHVCHRNLRHRWSSWCRHFLPVVNVMGGASDNPREQWGGNHTHSFYSCFLKETVVSNTMLLDLIQYDIILVSSCPILAHRDHLFSSEYAFPSQMKSKIHPKHHNDNNDLTFCVNSPNSPNTN